MLDIVTTYVGLKLRSPIITGSAGITETVERMKKAQDNGAGAVVMKSLFEDEVSRISPTPRFKVIHHSIGNKKTFSLYSYEQASEYGPEKYAGEIFKAKKELEIPIIASINCITEKGWVSYARMMERAGVDALEINLSCPHGSITFRGGNVEEKILDTARLVRKSVSLPIIAKLSPQLTSPSQMVKGLESLGINGVTIFNRLTGIEIDINEEEPVMHQGYAGHGGPWAMQYPLRWISEIYPQVKVDISGSGGVCIAEDVVKYLLAGATTVQMVTAIVLNGYGIIKEINDGLKEYMDKKGYERIEDFRGRICSRIKGTYEIKRTHYLKAQINDKLIPPCQGVCPVRIDIQGYIALISQGKFEETFKLIKDKVVFPSVLSRVCPAPCEAKCIRGKIDEPVSINALKRFVCDWARENLQFLPVNHIIYNFQSKVAIIGAGPAGLTCAYDLTKMGYKTVVFESESLAGGMLSFGIPRYRLPKKIVQEEIGEIKNIGVEIKLNTTIGKDLTLDELKNLGYKAIFLAIGAHRDKKLGILGENLKGVIPGLSFLKNLDFDRELKVGKRVAVIGGGNTAVDTARSSIRLGAKEVYLIYRRTKEEMPAILEEIEQAEEEGVKILYLTAPLEIIGNNGNVDELKCIPLVLGEKDITGRKRPLSIPASCFSLKIDTVIVAIGQTPDLSFLEKINGFQINKDGTLAIHSNTYATDVEGIFAAGDMVTGPATVVEAIAAGEKTAISIDRYLRGEPLEKKESEDEVVVPFERVLKEKGFVERKERKGSSFLPLKIRRSSFEEVKKVFTKEEAIEEAKRCLACGCGLGCGICEKVCIYSAMEIVEGKYKVNNDRCDGCGLCVEVCPKENIKVVKI